MTLHLHREFVTGCYRCDLNLDEVMDGGVDSDPTGTDDIDAANSRPYRAEETH